MTLSLRLFIMVALLSGYCRTVHAQLTITSVTPNPICAGASVTVTYNSFQSGTLSTYVYSTGSTTYGSPKQLQTITAGTSLTTTVPLDFTLASGSYIILLTNNTPSSTTYTSASAVTVNAIPPAPTVYNASYCLGASATSLIATSNSVGILNWYGTSLSGGTPSLVATTPSTSQAGVFSYYVSQSVNGCEGPRAALTVMVRSRPSSPSVSSITYCQGSTATALQVAPGASGNLNWYTLSTGGTASAVAIIPQTNAIGQNTYYVTQTVNGCESGRAAINVTINARPIVNIDPGNARLTPTQTSLTLTATASVSTLSWSTAETTTSIVVSTTGVYSVTATDANGCIAVANASISWSTIDEIYSIKMGAWDDPTIWSSNQVPTSSYAVRLRHTVSLSAGYEAQAGLLSYDTGGQLQTGIGSRIRLGPSD